MRNSAGARECDVQFSISEIIGHKLRRQTAAIEGICSDDYGGRHLIVSDLDAGEVVHIPLPERAATCEDWLGEWL